MARLLAALACAVLLPSLPLRAPAEPAPAEPAATEAQAETQSEAQTEAQAEAQSEEKTEALAAEAQNPIANLISVPFQNNLTPGMGPNQDNTLNVLNIQPVVPFALSKDLTLVTRTILPVLSQPTPAGTQNGIGDLNPSFFFVPKGKGPWTLGFGPTLVLPTASASSLGSGKWSAGPATVAVYSKGPWVAGALLNNVWSFAGDSDRGAVSAFLLQPFINYNLPNGWYLVTSPIVTANWRAASGDQWILPVGGGVGRVFRVGSQPINASLQAYANVVKPDNFGDVTIRAQVQFLFPN
ncbi:MAG: neuromedin U [Cyanobacteriota bacterium]|nr:neuromedin U [Cyanobacteriota bacterium]